MRSIAAIGLVLSACATAPPYRTVVFEGTCDASGAVAIDSERFAVADDEDNVLRIYHADRGGPPLRTYDLTPSLGLADSVHVEADMEAATNIGDRAFWLTSHARTKGGEVAPNRLLFVATNIPNETRPLELRGKIHRTLLSELANDVHLARFELAKAGERPPQELGGLNIEGMTATPESEILIGFRNPIPEGRALIARVLNPVEIADGKEARVGEPVLLDLEGRGVRSLSWWRGDFLILAGSYAYERSTRLYRWDGITAKATEVPLDFADLNPEAFFTPEDREEAMILSDDGHREIDGVRCKALGDPKKKSFRGIWALKN
jgi:hypothetical protein